MSTIRCVPFWGRIWEVSSEGEFTGFFSPDPRSRDFGGRDRGYMRRSRSRSRSPRRRRRSSSRSDSRSPSPSEKKRRRKSYSRSRSRSMSQDRRGKSRSRSGSPTKKERGSHSRSRSRSRTPIKEEGKPASPQKSPSHSGGEMDEHVEQEEGSPLQSRYHDDDHHHSRSPSA